MAWQLYHGIHRQIRKVLPLAKTLHLQSVAPALVKANNLTVAVPGTYRREMADSNQTVSGRMELD